MRTAQSLSSQPDRIESGLSRPVACEGPDGLESEHDAHREDDPVDEGKAVGDPFDDVEDPDHYESDEEPPCARPIHAAPFRRSSFLPPRPPGLVWQAVEALGLVDMRTLLHRTHE